MKTRTIITVALAIFAIGLGGCNMGPGTEAGEAYTEIESEVTYQADPPECYGLRHYHRWVCEDGGWTLTAAGRRDIMCDGTVFVVGDETDCYSDYATYNCDTYRACGDYEFVCPPEPTRRCRPIIFDPPTEFARVR